MYTSYFIGSCIPPCSGPSFDLEMVPSVAVESYDFTASDFISLDVHGYFEYTVGTKTGSMYLYPANWGANSDSCPLPSGAQTTSVYVGRNYQGPNTAGVTGHVWKSTYGATYEWGIGDYSGLYNEITDSTLSGHCSPLPQMS